MTVIILIGMPAAGKTTVSRKLALELGCDFIDTDGLIERVAGRSISELARLGTLPAWEENILTSLLLRECVVATGGSAIYSDRGMTNLSAQGTVIHLHAKPETIRPRITGERGIYPPGKSLEELYAERLPLYRKYADYEVEAGPSPHRHRTP